MGLFLEFLAAVGWAKRAPGSASAPSGTSYATCPPRASMVGTRSPLMRRTLAYPTRLYRFLNAGITSLANQRSCSLNSFGPMPSAQWIMKCSRPGIFRLDRLDALDDVLRRAAEPGLLRHAVGERGDLRGRAGRAPGAALLVGVAHEAERREPLVALVMRRLDPAHRLGLDVGEIKPRAPDHVLAELSCCRPCLWQAS